jgi:hypothetical protein
VRLRPASPRLTRLVSDTRRVWQVIVDRHIAAFSDDSLLTALIVCERV